MQAADANDGLPAAALIDKRIADLDDWRGQTLSRMRQLIHEAKPQVVEEWKWATPVWSHHGIICSGEIYQAKVKLTFAKGAALGDPLRLFNASLDGNTRRALDILQGQQVDAEALKALIRAAVAHKSVRQTGQVTLNGLAGGMTYITQHQDPGAVPEFLGSSNGNRSSRSIQRWRDCGDHHHHGAGNEGAAWRQF